MRSRIPPLRSLLVFDAVARHQSMARAAEALCLTASAVGQQVRQLEAQLGVRLLERSARGTRLTIAGQDYHARIIDDLNRLEEHTLSAMAQRDGGSTLVVGAVPVFADRWLLPRLAAFARSMPGMALQVRVFPNRPQAQDPAFDVAVHYDSVVWPGAARQPLMDEHCIAVCAPQSPFAAPIGRGDLRRVPLLHLASRPAAWQEWIAGARLRHLPAHPLAGHRFDLVSSLLEAAIAGMGVALVPGYAVERELAAGLLVQAHDHRACRTQRYCVLMPPHRQPAGAVLAFTQWLQHTVQAEQVPG